MTRLSASALCCAALGGLCGAVVPLFFCKSNDASSVMYIPFALAMGACVGGIIGALVFAIPSDTPKRRFQFRLGSLIVGVLVCSIWLGANVPVKPLGGGYVGRGFPTVFQSWFEKDKEAPVFSATGLLINAGLGLAVALLVSAAFESLAAKRDGNTQS